MKTEPNPEAAETAQTQGDKGGCSVAPCSAPPVLFPRNPERDETGKAVLYPGLPQFKGISALFETDEGEVVIIAPTLAALTAHVRKMGMSDEVSRDACMLTTWDRVPNDQAQTPPDSGTKDHE